MERYRGTVEKFCEVDVAAQIAWLAAIPLAEWPQQDRLSAAYPYPAMVSDQAWHGFGDQFESVVAGLMTRFPVGHQAYHRMLSVVVPGQTIADHDDVMPESWRVRLHMPLVTNNGCWMWHGGESVHMEVGYAYKVNTEVVHGLHNKGDAARIHFFFDVKE